MALKYSISGESPSTVYQRIIQTNNNNFYDGSGTSVSKVRKIPQHYFNDNLWVSVKSAADNNWRSVCWSPELGIFCAVSNSGTNNKVMTSPDGVTWTTRSTSGFDNSWNSVCWSPQLGLFCAVAFEGAVTGNMVMTSPDGITWTARSTSGFDNGWNSVCWSPELGKFCAVAYSGSGNRVMTSPNGIDWTTQTTNDNNWVGLCWSPDLGIFCAVASTGTENRVMTSPNGIDWTLQNTTGLDGSWSDICWSPDLGLFCVVSTGTASTNRIMTSPDGINWTSRTAPTSTNEWAEVKWSPELGIFCAVGNVNDGGVLDRIMTSPDGVTWTLKISAGINYWHSLCWSPELQIFCAVAIDGTGNRVMISQRLTTPQQFKVITPHNITQSGGTSTTIVSFNLQSGYSYYIYGQVIYDSSSTTASPSFRLEGAELVSTMRCCLSIICAASSTSIAFQHTGGTNGATAPYTGTAFAFSTQNIVLIEGFIHLAPSSNYISNLTFTPSAGVTVTVLAGSYLTITRTTHSFNNRP